MQIHRLHKAIWYEEMLGGYHFYKWDFYIHDNLKNANT